MKVGDIVYIKSLTKTKFRFGLDDDYHGDMLTAFKQQIPIEITYRNFDEVNCRVEINDDIEEYTFDLRDLTLEKPKGMPLVEEDLNLLLLENLLERESVPAYSIKGLDYDIDFAIEGLRIGCQKIEKKDALKLAEKILKVYGE